jgi:hypothetical protein
MKVRIFQIVGALAVVLFPLGLALLGIASNGISKGYVFQDKYEKLWIPYNLHVEMHENRLSRFAWIKDTRGKAILYFKNEYKTPHSHLFSDKDALSSDYKLVAELDTLDEHGLKRIKVLAARNYSRDFKIVTTRYAEFHYYPDSVDEEICDKIIFSIKNAP